MSTNFIWRILVANAAETAKPTAPSAGSNIADITGYTAIGSVARGDDGDLDADSVDIVFHDEYGNVMPPVSMAKADSVPMQNGVDSFSFVAYDISQTVQALASDMTFSSNVGTKTLNTTKRTVIIEINGVGMYYFPNVELRLSGGTAGIAADGQGKTNFYADVCKGATLAAGYSFTEYQ